MSYEGYSQFMCRNGHYWTKDAVELMYLDLEDYPKCTVCGEKHVWENSVNLTNGSFDENGKRIDGYVPVKIEELHTSKCDNCGREFKCSCTKYKIPPK